MDGRLRPALLDRARRCALGWKVHSASSLSSSCFLASCCSSRSLSSLWTRGTTHRRQRKSSPRCTKVECIHQLTHTHRSCFRRCASISFAKCASGSLTWVVDGLRMPLCSAASYCCCIRPSCSRFIFSHSVCFSKNAFACCNDTAARGFRACVAVAVDVAVARDTRVPCEDAPTDAALDRSLARPAVDVDATLLPLLPARLAVRTTVDRATDMGMLEMSCAWNGSEWGSSTGPPPTPSTSKDSDRGESRPMAPSPPPSVPGRGVDIGE